MKKVIIFIFLSTIQFRGYSNMIKNSCAFHEASKTAQFFSETLVPRDKFKHCSTSCVMSLNCGALDSFGLGVLKEIYDILGPGNSEVEDLIANLIGIKLNVLGIANSEKSCINLCSLTFPSFSPKPLGIILGQ
ncbi:MAG: hypothetical protein CME69_05880 [Halobacteriovorax sp.]|nr:hypothetical protein [Halobacteriovorax sp.]|tara:strand:- start:550 stop:948 length:399 start_codon:yes stop_codon:yes gene_type:complete